MGAEREAADGPGPGLALGPVVGFGFGADRRIRDSGVFRRTFDHGRNLRGRYMVVWLMPSAAPRWRLGVVASRRSFPRAVDRARAKRLIREAFRLSAAGLAGRWDAVIVARPPILTVGMQPVREEFVKLARAGTREARGP